MANIGSFKKSGSEFQGEIVTLSVQAKSVRIVPETNRANDNAPSHRVYVGRAEIGAAWSKRSNEGRDYLSVKLDDPSFNAPIYANLFDDEDGEGFTLIWSRRHQAQRRLSRTRQTPRPASGRGFLARRYGRIRHASSFYRSPPSTGAFLARADGGRTRRSAACISRAAASRSTTSMLAA